MTLHPNARHGAEALSHQAKAGVMPIEKPEPRQKTPRRPLRRVSAKRARERRREATYTFACDVEQRVATCWLAPFSQTPCSGRIEKVHLIAKQIVRREVWLPVANGRVQAPDTFPSTCRELVWDRRIWRFGCHGHHHDLDCSKQIVLGRSDLPSSVEEFAREYGLVAWLDRTYGELAKRAA
jgi:hypothetical protein